MSLKKGKGKSWKVKDRQFRYCYKADIWDFFFNLLHKFGRQDMLKTKVRTKIGHKVVNIFAPYVKKQNNNNNMSLFWFQTRLWVGASSTHTWKSANEWNERKSDRRVWAHWGSEGSPTVQDFLHNGTTTNPRTSKHSISKCI